MRVRPGHRPHCFVEILLDELVDEVIATSLDCRVHLPHVRVVQLA
jgi:hypothetical protein